MFIVSQVSLFSESLAHFFQGNKILNMFIASWINCYQYKIPKSFVKFDLVPTACIGLADLGGGVFCVQTVTSHIMQFELPTQRLIMNVPHSLSSSSSPLDLPLSLSRVYKQ